MKANPPMLFRGSLVLVAGLMLAATASASPRDELLRLVPDDVTFCALVQDLRERSAALKGGSFAERIAQLPLAQAKIKSPEFEQILKVQNQLLKELQISPEQARDDLLGDAIVFAYRQGPADKPEQEQALFLMWARDKALLGRVIDRLNEMQKKTGELTEVRSVGYRGKSYFQRVKAKANESEFYYIRDNVLAFSSQEAIAKTVIDRDQNEAAVEKQAPFWSKMLANLGIQKSLVVLLVNPRVFDNVLSAQEKAAADTEKAFLQEFRRYWQAFEGLGVYSDVGDHFELGIAIHVRKDALPKAAQQFFAGIGKPSALWRVIPEDCLFAFASRSDFALLAEVITGFAGDEKSKEAKKAFEGSIGPFLPANASGDVLLKGLGPDWGFWASAPAAADKTWVPQAMLAFKVQKTADGQAAEATVRNAMQFLLTTAQLAGKDLRVETIKHDNIEIKSLRHETLFPNGLRPSFAVKDGYLLFAGNPETIKRFTAPADANEKDFVEAPLLRVSAAGWHAYLSKHQQDVADFIAKATGTPAKGVAVQIGEVVRNLKEFDRLEVVVRAKTDRATIAIRVLAAKMAKR